MHRRHHTPPTGTRRHHTPSSAPRWQQTSGASDEFWGETANWPTSEVPTVTPGSPADRGGEVSHTASPTTLLDDEPSADQRYADDGYADDGYADLGDPADEMFDDERWDAAWQPAPRRTTGIDPFVLRVGAVVVALTLAVPLFLGFRSDGDDADSIRTDAAASSDASAPALDEPVPAADDTVEAGEDTGATAPAGAPSGSVEHEVDAAETAAACSNEYDVAAGDFWIRIADGSGVELAQLLTINAATIDTPLYPGTSICLPEGATTPPPPEAPVALTVDDESNSVNSGASASATAQPVEPPRTAPTPPPTTAAPTTTAPPPPPPAPTSPSDAVAIIRSVWPDELEERAITIAWRESNHRPEVYNGFCCYGLFQIYYDVHRSWLASDLGITSAQQLLDPVLNARAAYRLYERAGGWGPWSQTNY